MFTRRARESVEAFNTLEYLKALDAVVPLPSFDRPLGAAFGTRVWLCG